MNTGALRHRVTLDVPTARPGAFRRCRPAGLVCAYLSETAGVATLIGRYHPGITTATRVHFKTRMFHVVSIINREERDAELVLSCTEVFD